MKVRVLQDVRDRTVNLKLRKKEEVLEVDEKRAVKPEGLGLVKAVPEKKTNAVEKKG